MSSKYAFLDKLDNLQTRVVKGTKARKVGDARDDEVSVELAKAKSPQELAERAAGYGVPAATIVQLGKTTKNFGTFRMTLSNLMRGVVNRRTLADRTFGLKLTYAQCGTPEDYKAVIREHKAKNKPAKVDKPAKAKPDAFLQAKLDKKPKTRQVKGLDGVIRTKDASDTEDFPRLAKGAPSKAEAAKRGKGAKKAGRGAKSAAAGDVAARYAPAEQPAAGDGDAAEVPAALSSEDRSAVADVVG